MRMLQTILLAVLLDANGDHEEAMRYLQRLARLESSGNRSTDSADDLHGNHRSQGDVS